MRKIILSFIFFIFFLLTLIIGYLSLIGYETNKLNSLLENKIISNLPNTKINLNKIKIKINIKNLNFFISTLEPDIQYREYNIKLKRIDGYINLKSFLIGKPKIDKINILSNNIEINDIKNIAKYLKPSNFKKFFLNNVDGGETTLNLDLYLKNNKIESYEVNGVVKNFFAKLENLDFKKASFVYLFKKNKGELNNIRGTINGFQINSGKIEFNNLKSLNIKGNLKKTFDLNQNNIDQFSKLKMLKNISELEITGKTQSSFIFDFDKTLKLIDYKIESLGNINKTEIKIKKPIKYQFLKKNIDYISLNKTEFKINYEKEKKKLINISGSYKINNNSFQKYEVKHIYESKLQKLYIKGDFDNEINLPILNFNSKNKILSINTELEIKPNFFLFKKFILKEGKSKIDFNNLYIKDKKLIKLDNLTVKTFNDAKFNNDFNLSFDRVIKLKGSKYDASNLTKLFDKKSQSDFFSNINREILINVKEISTNLTDFISNFNLIGYIEKGKFNKIVSKGEFTDGKYLDISLKIDKSSKKKILEIYSDIPKPLLSNYKFFDGLKGGQLLLSSSYDSQKSDTNLIIENFKIVDAPDLVKLLSLADFGGMSDVLKGEGLSFDKLEMNMEKNNQILNLKELYAIGPSISILMDGYVESNTGLVSLRGTMVPAKTLNKFLSKLPIVGDILIPKEIGEGLFGISFKMKGKPGEIKTTVNPVKTLTPRFIQKALKKTK